MHDDAWLLTAKPVRLCMRHGRNADLQRLSRNINGLAAVNCARPTRHGNPYERRDDGHLYTPEMANILYRAQIVSGWIIPPVGPVLRVAEIKRTLRMKNLACFCREASEFCHVDTLLEVANS